MPWEEGQRYPRIVQPSRTLWNPDLPPETPNSHDDEFITPTLDAKWTITATPDNVGIITPNKFGTFLAFECPGVAANNQLNIRQPITSIGAAGTPFQVTTKVGLGAYEGALLISDILVTDNSAYATGNFILCALATDGTIAGNSDGMGVTVYDGGVQYAQPVGRVQTFIYIHIQRSASNVLRIYISSNGIAWKRIYSGSKTFNITYVFYRLYASTVTTVSSHHFVDWIRFNDPRYTQTVS